MSADKHFLDTNIFVYAFDLTTPEKAQRADELIYAALASGKGMVSYQVVQEFVAVVRKPLKTQMTLDQIAKYWDKTFRPLLQIHSSSTLFVKAIDLCRINQISWYDSLIVAAALQGGCKVLYSEDLQDGQRFGDLVVENPFR